MRRSMVRGISAVCVSAGGAAAVAGGLAPARALASTAADVRTAGPLAAVAGTTRLGSAGQIWADEAGLARAVEAAGARRAAVARARGAALARARSSPPTAGDPRAYAQWLLAQRGEGSGQWGCLDELWNRESGWDPQAANASGAFGIPQALPGSRMASAGADWQTNPDTQIRWGLSYIADRYGTPCAALAQSNAAGYY